MKNKILYGLFIILLIIIVGFVIYYSVKMIYKSNYYAKINEILSDDVEIEKKWLIKQEKIPYDLKKAEVMNIEQTYICFSPEMRVRRINNGESYTFTMKTNITEDGMTRDETEIEITEEEYNNLVSKKEGNTIFKTRYQFLDNSSNQLIAIDIFLGDLQGLAYMEIEFPNKEEANNYKTPEWVEKDVTDDLRYKNGHLARYGIPKDE